jgi:hypothetical protein
MAQTVETLIRENMHGIFGEHDAHAMKGDKIGAVYGPETPQKFRTGVAGLAREENPINERGGPTAKMMQSNRA